MCCKYESSVCTYLGSFIAASMHYFYLVGFFWLNVMCFDVSRQFVKKGLKLNKDARNSEKKLSKNRL